MTSTPAAKRKYHEPPIQEAICEIHFSSPISDAAEELERMSKKWGRDYPTKNFVQAKHIQFRVTFENTSTETKPAGLKLVMRSEDGKDLAQLAGGFLAVNRLRPYVGWDEHFRDTILRRYEDVRLEFGIEDVERVGLRYINRVDVPEIPIQWGNWFNVTLPFPLEISKAGGLFQSHYRKDLSNELESILNFGTAPTQNPTVTSVLLDIDVIWRRNGTALPLRDILELVHTPHNQLFESYLLDSTRKLFKIVGE